MILEEKLEEIGLGENEVKVYLALINLGKGYLYEIANKAGCNNVTTLNNLRSLEEKQLLHISESEIQKRYFMKDPRQGVREYLRQKQTVLDVQKLDFDEIVDCLEIMHHSVWEKPQVKFIHGDECPQAIRAEVESTKFEELYEFTNLDEAYMRIPPKRGDYRQQNRERPYKSVSIYTSSNGAILKKKTTKYKKRYYIPKSLFDFPGEIATFGDKTVIIAYSPQHIGVIIRDASIAKTMRAFFKLALESVEKYKDQG